MTDPYGGAAPADPQIVDVAIIGAGPTGLFAAYYAGFRGLKVALIDALPAVGGQITAMYPEKTISDVAGFPSIKGADLVAALEAQASPFAPRHHLGQRAETMSTVHDEFGEIEHVEVGTSAGTTVRARTVLVAGGVGGFAPRPLPGEAQVAAADIDHFVPDVSAYAGLDAVVVGGGDSALDWALALSETARSVTVVHRRGRFRAHAHSVERAQQLGIRLLTDAVLTGSRYQGTLVDVEVRHADGTVTWKPCQRVVAALGFTAQLGPILEWGLDVVQGRHIQVGTRMQTVRPRVFAAGDITSYDGKVPLIAVGFGEAATAVNNVCRVIDPTAPLFGGHSTDTAAPTTTAPTRQGAVSCPS